MHQGRGRSRGATIAAAAALSCLLAACAAVPPGTVTPARPIGSTTGTAPPGTAPTDTAPPGTAGPDATTAPESGSGPDAGPTAASPLPDGALGSTATQQGRGAKDAPEDAELVSLGEQLTAALASGDVEQWLALTTLQGEAEQQQRDWFAAVQAVPMDVREMHPTDIEEKNVFGDVDGPVVEFGFRHQVSGADTVPSVELYQLTLEREGVDGPFRVVEVGGSDGAYAAYPQLWDLGPVTVSQGEHVVLLTPDDEPEWAELLEELDSAAGAVLTAFPETEVQTMLVTAVDGTVLATLFGDSEEGALAGFTTPALASPTVQERAGLAELDTADGGEVTARIVLDADYVENELGYHGTIDGGDPLMRHEGTHLAMMLGVNGYPPAWVSEGFAGWFEVVGDQKVLDDTLRWYSVTLNAGGQPEGLPPVSRSEFFSDDADEVDRNYSDSAMVFAYMEQTHGYDATVAVGRQLHAMGLLDDEDEAIDAALVEHLGQSSAEFEQDWLDWTAELED